MQPDARPDTSSAGSIDQDNPNKVGTEATASPFVFTEATWAATPLWEGEAGVLPYMRGNRYPFGASQEQTTQSAILSLYHALCQCVGHSERCLDPTFLTSVTCMCCCNPHATQLPFKICWTLPAGRNALCPVDILCMQVTGDRATLSHMNIPTNRNPWFSAV